ncbi:hypothetical protein MTY66_60480 (plasmid) [Mycolicibacterium sp. TY66]|uniref:hypothetical protein n=1 Tax=Mycobacteriaceae TaxID=1762 RepID=UPI001042699A|nr:MULTISPECIES: hypothetical protein [Mycobacteriaceae]BCI84423.1 hypothetical protein MTY66_60480 [Mycolicibacterium sp. TY66]BCJ84654.1 hypothetical protein MTY81_60270 [Mycolicibacterium sp. TY81]
MPAADVLNFVGSHPQMALGVAAGAGLTAIVHKVIRRIKWAFTTGVAMAFGGGAAGGLAPQVNDLIQHFH